MPLTELIVFLVAIIAAILLYKILKTIKHMLINTVVGLVMLVVANVVFGLGIAYSWIVILTCAVAGSVGALLIILLHYLGIAF
ncbi:MAG: pro-sigmaK processing inhibitor BofA family protein [Methanosarcinaceae archaeon]|nr:pro-sigmaK processing inhibitor BofA family protein [Methanosarcinaceae archaeon]